MQVPQSKSASRAGTVRPQSSNTLLRASGSSNGNTLSPGGQSSSSLNRNGKGRARSSSLVTVTEVGGDEPENVVDRLGVGANENAAWVNAPGERITGR